MTGESLYGDIYRIGVGSRVARSTIPGNAKASMRGTSDRTDTHAFCICDSGYQRFESSLRVS